MPQHQKWSLMGCRKSNFTILTFFRWYPKSPKWYPKICLGPTGNIPHHLRLTRYLNCSILGVGVVNSLLGGGKFSPSSHEVRKTTDIQKKAFELVAKKCWKACFFYESEKLRNNLHQQNVQKKTFELVAKKCWKACFF